MIENLQLIAPIVGVYLFFGVCFWTLICVWIWWEDRNDGGTDNE